MTAAPAIELGPDRIIGSYRLVREIGRGGMGTVYEAEHVVLPRRAAIKIMHPELRKQPGMATRVVQEASILEDIKHPGIVGVYDCALLPDHRPWIAMELVIGETLATRLLQQGPLPAHEVAKLLADVADVLASVHAKGVVHRDLKPDNLILTPNDREFPLRVIDWGVARLGPMGRLTLDGLTPGTPIYMSPEQATGRNIAAPCDIYSLGVIAYEALTGHPPFDGRTLAEVVSMHLMSEVAPLRERCGAPKDLCDLVHKMLSKDPSLRPSAIEIRQLARLSSLEMTHAYESLEIDGIDRSPSGAPRHVAIAAAPTEDAVIVDPEALEFGVTELVPTIRRPRWTPQLGSVPVAPRAACDQVAGEIAPKRR